MPWESAYKCPSSACFQETEPDIASTGNNFMTRFDVETHVFADTPPVHRLSSRVGVPAQTAAPFEPTGMIPGTGLRGFSKIGPTIKPRPPRPLVRSFLSGLRFRLGQGYAGGQRKLFSFVDFVPIRTLYSVPGPICSLVVAAAACRSKSNRRKDRVS